MSQNTQSFAPPEATDKPKRTENGGLNLRQLWDRYGITVSSFILFIVAWEVAIILFEVPTYILPKPTAILDEFVQTRDLLLENTWVTVVETLLGFGVAVVIAIPLSMFVAFSPFLSKTLYPAAVALEMVPKIAFAPIFVIWFGFGLTPKIIIVFMVSFFPILLNGVLAFKSLDPDVIHFTQSTGASQWRMFWKIRLPSALPQIFTGIKGAATNATVGAVISEWIGGDAGLGYYLQIALGNIRIDLAFACIIMLMIIGLTLFYAVVLVERMLIPWHVSQRVGGRSARR